MTVMMMASQGLLLTSQVSHNSLFLSVNSMMIMWSCHWIHSFIIVDLTFVRNSDKFLCKFNKTIIEVELGQNNITISQEYTCKILSPQPIVWGWVGEGGKCHFNFHFKISLMLRQIISCLVQCFLTVEHWFLIQVSYNNIPSVLLTFFSSKNSRTFYIVLLLGKICTSAIWPVKQYWYSL
jgi:hypothetical protein